MNLVKKIILDHYATHFKATIGDTFIAVRKTEIVPKSHVNIKWMREHFYSVRKIGKNVKFKTQCMVSMKLIEALRDMLIEKDGEFVFDGKGNQPDGTRIHIAWPDWDNPRFECLATISNSMVLHIYQQFNGMPVKGRKHKKFYKRFMFHYKQAGRGNCIVTQSLIINAYVMQRIIELLVGDGENGYYFDYDKVEQEDRMI